MLFLNFFQTHKHTIWILLVLFVLVIIIIIAAGFFLRSPRSLSKTPASSSEATLDPLNAAYIIDGTVVNLINGIAEQEAAPGSAEKITTRIFGQPVAGDINGDGKNDAAVFLVQDGAGSGAFYYAAAALGTSTGTIGTNAIFLGDRIAPDTIQIANGIVTVNYADRAANEPMSAVPSVGVSKYLVLASSTLYDTSVDIYPLPPGFTWNEKRAATMAPGDINITSTLTGIKIESQPITNITDLSAKATPFDAYYKKKLTAAGWTEDNALAAGGPGAEITGYKKGSDYIILEYISVFKNMPADSPETCPCDMTFSVFAGTSED